MTQQALRTVRASAARTPSTSGSTSAARPAARWPTTCTSTSSRGGPATPTSSPSSAAPRRCRSCSTTPATCSPTRGPIGLEGQPTGWGCSADRPWNARIAGFMIRPSRISIARLMRLVGVPRLGPGQHRLDERQQRLAVLPGRRVPEVRRAVVDRVVVDAVADGEHRVVERRRHGPLEAHRPRRTTRRRSGCPGGTRPRSSVCR